MKNLSTLLGQELNKLYMRFLSVKSGSVTTYSKVYTYGKKFITGQVLSFANLYKFEHT